MTIRQNPPLTYERANEVLEYDPETGILTWRKSRPGVVAGTTAGTPVNGYLQVQVDRIFYRAHRVCWLLQTGSWPNLLLDHINGRRSDNRWCNLREASYQQNAFNKRAHKNSKSGLIGVSPTRNGRWQADIGYNGKVHHLGQFECIADAVAARCAAETHYFGSFARQASRYSMTGG